MIYSIINKNDLVDEEFITHLNNILDLLQQIDSYINHHTDSDFIKQGLTQKEITALVSNVRIELNMLYKRYTDMGYTDVYIAHQFKTCYEALCMIA